MYDYVIVGAGMTGCVIAERLAVRGKKILLVEQRAHVGGNAYDYYNDAGIRVHEFGPHIFHTNSADVFAYLSRFTKWRNYEHEALASVNGELVKLPIHPDTMKRLYGYTFGATGLAGKFKAEGVDFRSENAHLGQLFKRYLCQQWGMASCSFSDDILRYVPVRAGGDNRYFTTRFQAVPVDGYTAMFNKMLCHPGIEIKLQTAYQDLGNVSYRQLVYTGSIDEYYSYRLGKLPYHSLHFRHMTLNRKKYQSAGAVYFPDDPQCVRITEHKYITGQLHDQTVITFEQPVENGIPLYPVITPESIRQHAQYTALGAGDKQLWFAGRLGCYRYYNLGEVVAQALSLCVILP